MAIWAWYSSAQAKLFLFSLSRIPVHQLLNPPNKYREQSNSYVLTVLLSTTFFISIFILVSVSFPLQENFSDYSFISWFHSFALHLTSYNVFITIHQLYSSTLGQTYQRWQWEQMFSTRIWRTCQGKLLFKFQLEFQNIEFNGIKIFLCK